LLLATFGCTDEPPAATDRPPPAVASTVPTLDRARVAEFTSDLQSGDLVALRRSVLVAPGVSLDQSVAEQLRNAGPFEFRTETFTPTGPDTATLRAGTPSGEWLVGLIFRDGRWMIATTEPSQ